MTLPLPSPNLGAPAAPKRPRRTWTPAEQAAHVADFAASGLSPTAFCRRLGIRRATLARWRQRAVATLPARARRATRPRAGAAGFAAVTVMPDPRPPHAPAPALVPTAHSALTLVLRAPSGVAVDVGGIDVASAAALLRAVLTPTDAPAMERRS